MGYHTLFYWVFLESPHSFSPFFSLFTSFVLFVFFSSSGWNVSGDRFNFYSYFLFLITFLVVLCGFERDIEISGRFVAADFYIVMYICLHIFSYVWGDSLR